MLERFGSNLYLSKLVQGINELDDSILSNQTTILLRKSVNLTKLVESKGVSIEFRNPLYHPHDGHSPVVTSSSFSHVGDDGTVYNSVSVTDDGNGNLDLVVLESSGVQRKVLIGIGTVDYENGAVKFNTNFTPISQNIFFTITVQPDNKDIFVFENKILRVSRGYSDSVKVSLVSQENRKQSLRGTNVGH